MKILQKQPSKDFVVLNLTDPQLSDAEWADGHGHRLILEHTVKELVNRVNPSLITISGDLAWAGHNLSYDSLAKLIDSLGIPWAPVWGNHDNQGGAEYIDGVANRYMAYPNCIYEKGDPTLGNGNYVIRIEENGEPISAIIMADSHDREPFIDANGNESVAWAKLTAIQGEWIESVANELKADGYRDATLLLHIPIYAYRQASAAAYKDGLDLLAISNEESQGESCWNGGYTDSTGVQYEEVSSYPGEDGIFDIIKRSGIIKRVITGHDHINNWMISYDGIDLIYSLKTGAGCYWRQNLSGGTILTFTDNKNATVRHEYVDTSHIVN